ncbi:hypothetical protein [Saccharothrix sp. Mg75]|uniref:hypothetical protein n=1 Tax=Saccharothrix sp. Mg75 TaxID=3445357 RepID=UPI003EEAB1BA
MVQDAQRDGSLRADLAPGDLFVVFWSHAQLVRATHATAPDAWRRNLAIFLDGAHAGAARELPVGPDALPDPATLEEPS